VPIFTLALINAQIPNVHMILRYLADYSDIDSHDNMSYNIANLEGSVFFVMDFDVPADIYSAFHNSNFAHSIQTSVLKARLRESGGGGGGGGVSGVGGWAASQSRARASRDDSLHSKSPQHSTEPPPPPSHRSVLLEGGGETAADLHCPALWSEMLPAPVDRSADRAAYTSLFDREEQSQRLANDKVALEKLGDWLREQQTMEDTINILQKEGWMA
jgi:hypothetical protein